MAKILGVYTVVSVRTGEEIHFMMMANLLKRINKKHLLRVYDMKGSVHQRQVMQDNFEAQRVSQTLKDIDFLNQ